MTWRQIVILVGALLLLAAFLFLAMGVVEKSEAHSWYDGSCCSEQDCYQTGIGEVERRPDGWFVVLTKELIPFDDERIRRSLDPLIHRCVITTWKGQVRVPREVSPTLCLYIPELPV